jgi:hypothetical protein
VLTSFLINRLPYPSMCTRASCSVCWSHRCCNLRSTDQFLWDALSKVQMMDPCSPLPTWNCSPGCLHFIAHRNPQLVAHMSVTAPHAYASPYISSNISSHSPMLLTLQGGPAPACAGCVCQGGAGAPACCDILPGRAPHGNQRSRPAARLHCNRPVPPPSDFLASLLSVHVVMQHVHACMGDVRSTPPGSTEGTHVVRQCSGKAVCVLYVCRRL